MIEPYRAAGLGPRVLIIDADAPFVSALRHALELLGCAVVVARDIEECVAYVLADRPHLVFVSIELPGTSGFAVCNRLKKDANLRSIPIVMMSRETPVETIEQHGRLRTHADLYVQKRIAIDALLRQVTPWLSTNGDR